MNTATYFSCIEEECEVRTRCLRDYRAAVVCIEKCKDFLKINCSLLRGSGVGNTLSKVEGCNLVNQSNPEHNWGDSKREADAVARY